MEDLDKVLNKEEINNIDISIFNGKHKDKILNKQLENNLLF